MEEYIHEDPEAEYITENLEYDEEEKKVFVAFIESMNQYLSSVSDSEKLSWHERVEALQGIIEIMMLVEQNYDVEQFGLFITMDFTDIKRKAEIMVFYSERRFRLNGKIVVENPMPISINEWNIEG